MADPPLGFLLQEVVHKAVLRLAVVAGEGVLVHVVQQIEIEVVHAAAAQLLLKDPLGRHGPHALDVLVAGELVGQVPALPRIPGQGFAETDLGFAAVVGMGGVEVIDAGGHRRVHHPVQMGLVDAAVVQYRQAHGPKAEGGECFALKLVI